MARIGRRQTRSTAFTTRTPPPGFRPDLQGTVDAVSGITGRLTMNKAELRGMVNAASNASGAMTIRQETVLNDLVTNREIVERVNYQIVLYDIVTRTQKVEMPAAAFTWSEILNSPGSFSGTIPLDHAKATRENLDPGSTAIYVIREGIIVWSGLLDAVKPDWAGRNLTYVGTGFLSGLGRRFLHGRQAMEFASAAGVFTYRPSSDALETNVTGYPDDTNRFNNVDEADLDLNDYITAVTQIAAYQAHYPIQVANFAGLTIASVRVTALISSVTGYTFVSPYLNLATVDYTVPTFTRAPNYGVAICSATWSNNPATGAPWLPAEVAAFSSGDEAGVRIVQPFDTADTIIWQLWMDVTWEANPSGAIFWDDVEQVEIARDMIRHTQAQVGGDLHFALDGTTSGIHRTQHNYAWENKQILSQLTTLAKLDHGFDYAITSEWDTTVHPPRPQETFHVYYPKRGSHVKGVRFDRNNLLDFDETCDGTKIANRVDVIGAGEGQQMLVATRFDSAEWADKPLWEKVVPQKQIDQQPTLDALADQNLETFKHAQELPKIVVRPVTKVAPVGSFHVGDTIEVFLDEGFIQYDKVMRVQRIDVQVDSNLNENQSVTFADVVQTDTQDQVMQ